MRINLFSVNATALTLHGEIQTTDDIVSVWREVGLGYDENLGNENLHVDMLHAIAGYRSRGQVHQILFSLTSHRHGDAENEPWYMHLQYLCPASEEREIRNPPREVTRNTRKLEEFLDSIVFKNVASDLHFDISYRFEPDSVETIIAVPLIKFNDDSLPFTDIRGVRLTKETRTEVEYTVALNSTRRGVINLSVSFHTDETLNTRLPANLLTRANNIVSKFITKKD